LVTGFGVVCRVGVGVVVCCVMIVFPFGLVVCAPFALHKYLSVFKAYKGTGAQI
jgi:hypothetical protein